MQFFCNVICIELCCGCDEGRWYWRPDGRRSLLLDDRRHGNPTERWWWWRYAWQCWNDSTDDLTLLHCAIWRFARCDEYNLNTNIICCIQFDGFLCSLAVTLRNKDSNYGFNIITRRQQLCFSKVIINTWLVVVRNFLTELVTRGVLY